MFYDPDAPKIPGQPDYSKGCIQDLPDDMRDQPQEPAELAADNPTEQPPASASSSSTSTSASSTSSSESDSSSHPPHRTFRHGAAAASVPSHVGADDMAAFYPAAAASSFHPSPSASLLSSSSPPAAASESFLTSVSPYLSVLYALLAAVLLLSFYFVPQSRPLRRKQNPASADKQQVVDRVQQLIKAATPTPAQQQQPRPQLLSQRPQLPPQKQMEALSAFLPAPSPLTTRYLANAATIPPHIANHFTPLELSHTLRTLLTAFDEDVGAGDLTTLATVPDDATSSARFLAKESGVLSGVHVAELVFHLYDPQLSTTWSVADGATVRAGTVVGVVTGSSRSLLTSERLALNVLQRMSGIATQTAALRGLIEAVNSPTLLLDTRKTAPGMRMLDKMAVRAGGAVNHRIGLYDMVMIKDNHITAAGGIPQAIDQVKQWLTQQHRTATPIEVETRTIPELKQLLTHLHNTQPNTTPIPASPASPASPLVTRVMLDNMVLVKRDDATGAVVDVDVSMLREAVELLRGDDLGRGLESEASGNVTAETIGRIAETHVTFISVGAITHSVRALDISLKIQ